MLINLVLLVGFAGSLRDGTPLVERFARMQVDDLSPAEIDYCRKVTRSGASFFVLNGSIAGAAGADRAALVVGALHRHRWPTC